MAESDTFFCHGRAHDAARFLSTTLASNNTANRDANAVGMLVEDLPAPGSVPTLDLLALDNALERLGALDPRSMPHR